MKDRKNFIATAFLLSSIAACSTQPVESTKTPASTKSPTETLIPTVPTWTPEPEKTPKPTQVLDTIGMLDVNGKPLYHLYNVYHNYFLSSDPAGKENIMTTLPHGKEVLVVGIARTKMAVCIMWSDDGTQDYRHAGWISPNELSRLQYTNPSAVANFPVLEHPQECITSDGIPSTK